MKLTEQKTKVFNPRDGFQNNCPACLGILRVKEIFSFKNNDKPFIDLPQPEKGYRLFYVS